MKRQVFSILFLSQLAFFPFISTPEAKAENIDEVAAEIIKSAPRLVSTDLSLKAGEAALSSSANLPDPELEGEYLAASAGETDRWGVGVSWGIDWPGVYAARSNEAAANARVARASEQVMRKETLVEVKRLLLDYILASRKIRLLKEISIANDSVAALAEKGFRGGEMTRLDLSKLRIEKLSINSSIVEAENERQAAVAALSAIYGKDCGGLISSLDLKFPNVQVPTREQLDLLSASNPRIAEAEVALEAAQLAGKTASREALPSLSIGYRHAFEDGVHFNGGSLGVSIPVFSSKGKKKAAKAAAVAAEYDLAVAKSDLSVAIDATLSRLVSLDAGVRALSKELEEADDSELLLKAYQGKVITLIELLNERNYFLDARLNHLELLSALSNACLDLEALLP